MRLNTGTILLIVVALVVIVAGVFITSQPDASIGDPTATPAAVSGPVFGGIDPLTVSQLRIVNHDSGEYVTLSRDSGGAWGIGGSYSSTVTPPLQDAITTNIGSVVTLNYTDTFPGDDLASFGLDTPTYTLTLYTTNGGEYTLLIGGKNPGGNRYYAVIQAQPGEGTAEPISASLSVPEATIEAVIDATAEATSDAAATPDRFTGERPTLSGGQNIVLLNTSVIDPYIGLIALPPYAPTNTPLPPPTATPNPYSEVEMTATAVSAMATQNAAIMATATAMAQVTDEATIEAIIELTPTAETTP